MTKGRGARVGVVAVAAALALLALSTAARAEVSEDAVRARISQAYGVKVLKVRRAEDASGRSIYLVTVMNPGGDFNEAFQVNTLAVDVATGNLIQSYRHRTSGVNPNEAPSFIPNRQPTNALGSGVVVR